MYVVYYEIVCVVCVVCVVCRVLRFVCFWRGERCVRSVFWLDWVSGVSGDFGGHLFITLAFLTAIITSIPMSSFIFESFAVYFQFVVVRVSCVSCVSLGDGSEWVSTHVGREKLTRTNSPGFDQLREPLNPGPCPDSKL